MKTVLSFESDSLSEIQTLVDATSNVKILKDIFESIKNIQTGFEVEVSKDYIIDELGLSTDEDGEINVNMPMDRFEEILTGIAKTAVQDYAEHISNIILREVSKRSYNSIFPNSKFKGDGHQ